MSLRGMLRYILALFYAAAGYFHLATPETFLQIMPLWVPAPQEVVFWTGIAELAGAAELAQPHWPALRRAAGIGLALYALCVWPANINHMLIDTTREDGGFGMAYHIPRMVLQPILIWLALWVGGATDWPWRRTR
jgi:uncharacterized membrane protein